MPSNLVKTERDERLWEKAKDQAKEAGKAEDWAYVNGIFQRMKHRDGGGERTSAIREIILRSLEQ